MSKKRLLPTLAAPVDRTSIASGVKKNDSAGVIPLDRYCDWCLEDCRKAVGYDPDGSKAKRCIQRTCELRCWEGTDIDTYRSGARQTRQTGYNTGYNNYGYNNYGYNTGYNYGYRWS